MLNTSVALRLQMSGALHLVVENGNETGKEIIVSGDDKDIGSLATAGIFIDDPLVSPRHARLVKKSNWWTIHDLNSENGTFVNDKLITEAPLFPNSTIIVGNTTLTVAYSEPVKVDTALIHRSGQWVQLPRIIAHELKNYLQFFDAGLEQLKQNTDVIEKYEGEIRSLEMAGEKMDELVQMLRAGCVEPVFTQVDLVELVWEQISLIEGSLQQKGVALNVDLPEKRTMISADSHQLGRAILNLLKNAMEACLTSGSIHVTISDRSDNSVSLVIQDTGHGMDSQTLKTFWEPLFTTRDQGNGLGAFIARTTVLKHKGSIHAESEPGKGTEIKIELPGYSNTKKRTDIDR
ncbi:MAG: ATP-binding protein [bacterium]